ncbi:MAG: hypothetical protein AAF492_27995, partial [Verrucomicrobiota bacterium]
DILPSALTANGLLDDGATLWFSALVGLKPSANGINARLGFCLATDGFDPENGSGNWYLRNAGSGVGIETKSGVIRAAEFHDAGEPTLDEEASFKYSPDEFSLVVGTMEWGGGPASNDVITLYAPKPAFESLGQPISTFTTVVDQAAFDTLTFRWGDEPELDEIRFGPSLVSVVLGTDNGTPDLRAPEPNPMQFAGDPLFLDPNTIQLTAVGAMDVNGPVEYYFENTNTMASSGWTLSPVWTNHGLSTGTTYAFRVKARDAWSNETAWSATVIAGGAVGLPLIYEPFDYPAGPLHGQSGSTEVGLDGVWEADATTLVVSNSLTYHELRTTGNRLDHFTGSQNPWLGKRAVSASALFEPGWLDHGRTLWFSLIGGSATNANFWGV